MREEYTWGTEHSLKCPKHRLSVQETPGPLVCSAPQCTGEGTLWVGNEAELGAGAGSSGLVPPVMAASAV